METREQIKAEQQEREENDLLFSRPKRQAWQAQRIASGEFVLIGQIEKGQPDEDGSFVEGVRWNIYAAKQLDHDCIMTIMERIDSDKAPYFDGHTIFATDLGAAIKQLGIDYPNSEITVAPEASSHPLMKHAPGSLPADQAVQLAMSGHWHFAYTGLKNQTQAQYLTLPANHLCAMRVALDEALIRLSDVEAVAEKQKI